MLAALRQVHDNAILSIEDFTVVEKAVNAAEAAAARRATKRGRRRARAAQRIAELEQALEREQQVTVVIRLPDGSMNAEVMRRGESRAFGLRGHVAMINGDGKQAPATEHIVTLVEATLEVR
jgi:hypothetical protein